MSLKKVSAYTTFCKPLNKTGWYNIKKEHKIEQAVILAGGKGTRLRPITDTMPKPMISFYEKPFLEYLIDNLKENGISKVVLLLGYLPEVIKEYFGDGRKFGITIEYSVTDVDNDTGKRMKLAQTQLDDEFLFMYCDNYWPIRLNEMYRDFVSKNISGQLTVYSNEDNYTRSNLKVDCTGLIIEYDKSRKSEGLEMVDIGFGIFKKEIIDLLPDDNISFENTAYPLLIKKRQLGAYVTRHRYYSVNSHERLYLTEEFLKRKPAIILDRDGVLNKKAPKAEYITKWSDFKWIDGSKQAIVLLKQAGYTVIIVSNQAGISRDVMTEADLKDIHDKMKEEVRIFGGGIDAIYHCPHGWDEGCSCRKPNPGMLFQAQRDFSIDLSKTYFIGDDIRDKQAGDAAGCKTILVSNNNSLIDIVKCDIL